MASEPRRIGDYSLGRRIAVGGMAEIFEARRDGAKRDAPPVVVKVLLPQYAKDPEVVRMLEHEAELQERLAHPGLVRVLSHGQEEGQSYIVMEHVDGVALSELMAGDAEEARRFPEALAIHVVKGVAGALDYVHSATDGDGASLDIVHRDVTPQNILISRSGDVRLGDFGIARSSLRDARTRTGVIKGKLRYVAPEQVTGSAMDGRTDLYGLGVVAFELLTGQPYLTADSEIDLLREAEQPTPKRLAEHVPEVDPALDRLLARVLSRFPEERPRSVAEFSRELRAIRPDDDDSSLRRALGARVAVIAPPSPTSAPQTPDAVPRGRRSWFVPVVLGAATVAAAGLGVLLLREPPRPRPVAADAGVSLGTMVVDGAAESSVTDANAPVDAARGSDLAPAADPPMGVDRLRVDRPRMVAPAELAVDPGIDEARRSAIAGRLAELRAVLRRRGVRGEDLAPTLRDGLTSIERALADGRLDDADAGLAAATRNAEAIVVDAAFVRRKVQRVDAAIRRADQSGADTRRAERLSASALADFMAGRHEAANRRLNEILDSLP